jgi:uncharacterized Zn finger protein
MKCPDCGAEMQPNIRVIDGKEIPLQGYRCSNYDCGYIKRKETVRRAGAM